VSFAIALYLPFQLFLFAYAILGPRHLWRRWRASMAFAAQHTFVLGKWPAALDR